MQQIEFFFCQFVIKFKNKKAFWYKETLFWNFGLIFAQNLVQDEY